MRSMVPGKLELLLLVCIFPVMGWSQQNKAPNPGKLVLTAPEVRAASFNTRHFFVEHKGQYVFASSWQNAGSIHAAFEGFSAPVLFTEKGMLFLQEKQTRLSHHEEEELEEKGIPEEEIERRRNVINQSVFLEWAGANPAAEMQLLDKLESYNTYGSMPGKAYNYQTLLCKDIYPGIDVLYSLSENATKGFEYSFIVHPGADPARIRLKFTGDIQKLKLNREGDLIVQSGIDEIIQSGLKSFEAASADNPVITANAPAIATFFEISGNEVQLKVSNGYDHTKTLVIDPFVSSAAALTGAVAGMAKDVDFDYAGNVYVTGGGDGNVYQMAKFSATGVLQWTFNGTVNNPQWSFGPYFGGWVVEKTTGNIYLGQGFDFLTGFIVVRISTTGLYDNYVTTGNPNFRENWKMIWNCNNGLPQIIVAGGGYQFKYKSRFTESAFRSTERY